MRRPPTPDFRGFCPNYNLICEVSPHWAATNLEQPERFPLHFDPIIWSAFVIVARRH